MPEKRTVARAKAALRSGKRPTTAAGPFVREEMDHVREGKHGVRSRKQAIAIDLSKARRAGVPLPPQGKPKAGARTRRSMQAARKAGRKTKAPARRGTSGGSRGRTRRGRRGARR